MMPITDSSVSDETDVRVAGPARQVAVGENNSCGLLPFSGPLRLLRRRPERKLRVLTASVIFARDQSATGRDGRLSGLTQPLNRNRRNRTWTDANLGVECVMRAGELAAGPGPRLAAEAGRRPMFGADLSTRERDGHVVAALGGELDLEAAANARRSRRAAVPLRRPRRTRWPIIVQSGTPSSRAEHGSPRQQTAEAGASPPHSRTAEPMTVKDGPAFQSAARNMARRDPDTVLPFPGCGDDG